MTYFQWFPMTVHVPLDCVTGSTPLVLGEQRLLPCSRVVNLEITKRKEYDILSGNREDLHVRNEIVKWKYI